MKRKVAIVGTAGLPAAYGGFETLADNLVVNLSDRFDFLVYCKKTPKASQKPSYAGARLKYLPFQSSGWQSFPYDTVSLLHALAWSDVVLYLGPVAGPVLALNALAGKRLVVNFGGLNEWEREKLSPSERKFLFWSFAQAANHADVLVADNFELQKSIAKSFGKKAEVIRYGGDHVSVSEDAALFEKYPFATGKYFVSVSRAQVDNNLHIVIDAFRAMPDKHLVLISNWSVSEYGRKLFAENQGIPNVTLQPAVYDSRELNFLRGRAVAYVHSHSYCGTAPSLVEAMCLGLPILSWDVPTNRETTQGNAIFFHSVDSLIEAIRESTPETLQGLAEKTAAIAQSEYTWKHIAEQYAQFFQ